MTRTILRSTVFEGEAFATAALITDLAGNALQTVDVSSWTLRIYDLDARDPQQLGRVLYEETLDPSVTNTNPNVSGTPVILSDTIRSDTYWSGEPPGYNFLRLLVETDFTLQAPDFVPVGGHTYRQEFRFDTVDGLIFLDHRVQVLPTTATG